MNKTPQEIGAAAAEVDKTIKQQYGEGALACCVVLIGGDNFTVLNVGPTDAQKQLRMVLAAQSILAQIAVDLSAGNMPPAVFATPTKKEDWN